MVSFIPYVGLLCGMEYSHKNPPWATRTTVCVFVCVCVSGEIPGVRPEWNLPGGGRHRHPCVHLQTVVRGAQLLR